MRKHCFKVLIFYPEVYRQGINHIKIDHNNIARNEKDVGKDMKSKCEALILNISFLHSERDQ